MKTCSVCKKKQLIDAFHRYSRSPDGLKPYCKECAKNAARERRKRLASRARIDIPKVKTCRTCGNEKSSDYFSRCRAELDGLQKECKLCNEKFRSERREELRIYSREHYRNNIERHKKWMSDWNKRNPNFKKEYNKEYYAKNKDELKKSNKEWAAKNPEKVALYSRRKRAKRSLAAGKHSTRDVRRIAILQRWKCAICKTSVRNGYHVDHVVALKNGGNDNPSNLQILCPPCNLSKGARCPIEFAQSKGLLL